MSRLSSNTIIIKDFIGVCRQELIVTYNYGLRFYVFGPNQTRRYFDFRQNVNQLFVNTRKRSLFVEIFYPPQVQQLAYQPPQFQPLQNQQLDFQYPQNFQFKSIQNLKKEVKQEF